MLPPFGQLLRPQNRSRRPWSAESRAGVLQGELHRSAPARWPDPLRRIEGKVQDLADEVSAYQPSPIAVARNRREAISRADYGSVSEYPVFFMASNRYSSISELRSFSFQKFIIKLFLRMLPPPMKKRL